MVLVRMSLRCSLYLAEEAEPESDKEVLPAVSPLRHCRAELFELLGGTFAFGTITRTTRNDHVGEVGVAAAADR